METRRKYPVGIQSFENIRRDGYLYVDKTPIIYKMITEGVPYFLSQSDLVVIMPRGIYVMETKYDRSAAEALAQIDAKGYAAKYATDGRPVTKVGINFSSAERNITEWQAVQA